MAVLIFEINPKFIDFNLSPDKRDICIINENKIIETFRNYLIQLNEKNMS